MTLNYGYNNRTLVTADNLDDAKDALNAGAQRAELTAGCEIWLIQHTGTCKGYFTAWPNGRGAVEFGGDSVWGEFVGGKLYTEETDDNGDAVVYDAAGEQVAVAATA